MASSTSFMLKPNPTKILGSCDVGSSQAGSLSFDKKYTAMSSSSSLSIKASASSVSRANSVVKKANSNLARVWREVQGVNNWEGLLEPLNSLLQGEIIRYGEFVTACYKAFDLDPNSRRYLNCKYGKKKILKAVGMEGCGYEVTKYIYATPDITIPTQNGTCCSRWIGYVAVSSDEEVKRLGRRDVVVTFRGTVTNTEWIANFMSSLSPARLDPYDCLPNVKVESGFLSVYTSDDSSCKFRVGSCREQLLSELSRIINKYKNEDLSITLAGHSMGSSLAVLQAYDIAELGLNKNASNQEIPITVFSFGGPRVGNSEFKKRCEELGVKVLRVVNTNDPVTKLPGIFFNENIGNLGGRCYAHLGVELALDFFQMQDPACVHDLGTYIDLLRCPKETLNHRIFGSEAIVRKAKEMILNAEKFETYPWENAARNVGDLVQSLIT